MADRVAVVAERMRRDGIEEVLWSGIAQDYTRAELEQAAGLARGLPFATVEPEVDLSFL